MKDNKALKRLSATAVIASSLIPQSMPVFAKEESRANSFFELSDPIANVAVAQQVVSQSKADALINALKEASKEEAKAEEAVATAEQNYATVRGGGNEYQPQYYRIVNERHKLENSVDQKLDQEITTGTAELEKMVADYEDAIEKKEALESELTQKQGLLESEKSKLEDLEQAVEQAKAEYDALEPGAIEAAEQKNAEAMNLWTNAQIALQEAQNALTQAEANYAALSQSLESTRATYNEALNAVMAAQAAYDQALAVQAEKEANLALAENEEVYAQAEAELQNAQQAVSQAQAMVEQSAQSVAESENQLVLAQSAFDQAASELPVYQQAIADAQTGVENAESEVSRSQAALEQALMENKKQAEAQKNAQLAVEKAENAVKLQTEAVDIAGQEVKGVQAKIDNLQSQLETNHAEIKKLEEQLQVLQAQYASGSLGFFQAIDNDDATKAMNVILSRTDGLYDYTHVGKENDATSLENMKASLAWIKECNELRAKHGLPALGVNSYMMAIAQKQLNYSAVEVGHSQKYQVGENLAWGYENPFDGWYDKEKAIYERYLAQGLTPEEIENDHFQEVGHYLNIIEDGYYITGFAVNTEPHRYNVAYGQVFTYRGSGYTVENYEKMLDDYCSGIEKAIAAKQEELETAQADNSLVKAIEQAEAELKTKVAEAERQKQLLSQREVSLEQAVTLSSQAAMALTNSQALLKKAEDNLKAKEEMLSQAQAILSQKENALQAYLESDELRALQNNIDLAQARLNQANTTHQTHTALLAQNQSFAQDKKNQLAALERLIANAKTEWNEAKKDTQDKSEKLKSVKQNAETVRKGLESLETETGAAEAKLNEHKKEAAQKAQDEQQKKKAFDEANKTFLALDGLRVRYEETVRAQNQAVRTIESLEKEVPALRTSIQNAQNQIAQDSKRQTQARAYLAQLHGAKDAWNAIKKGQSANFDPTFDDLAAFPVLFANYQSLKKDEQLAKAKLEQLIADADSSLESLRQAKAEYEKAKQARQAAQNVLDAFLKLLENEETIVVDTNPEKKENTDSKKESSPNTAAGTGLYIYTAGTVLSGAIAVAFLKRKKD